MNSKITLSLFLGCSATFVSAADKATGKEAGGLFMAISMLILFGLASVLLYVLMGLIKKNCENQKLLKEAIAKNSEMEAFIQAEKAEKEELVKKFAELQKVIEKDEKTIAGLRETLKSDSFDGIFPICAKCKDIRDEKGFWHPIEEYLQNLSPADFSHSLCPNCAKVLYPDLFKDGNKPHTLTWK